MSDPARRLALALRAPDHRQPINPKAVYRTRDVVLFEEAANLIERQAALLADLEWSSSTGWTGLACCPLCSQKMDDGHLPDCPFTGSDASSRGDMIHDDESLRVLVRTLCNDAGSVAEWARRSGLVDEQVGLFLRGARPAEPRILAALGMTKRVTYSAAHGHSGDCGFAALKDGARS